MAAAPAIAKPAGQQRACPKRDESTRRVRQQLGIGHAERRSHHDDGGGKNQHRIMVDEVCGVDEADPPCGGVHEIVSCNFSKQVIGSCPDWMSPMSIDETPIVSPPTAHREL